MSFFDIKKARDDGLLEVILPFSLAFADKTGGKLLLCELHFLGLLGGLIDLLRIVEGGNDALHRYLYRLVCNVIFRIFYSGVKYIDFFIDLFSGKGGIVLYKDEVVVCFTKVFGLDKKLLVELFSGAKPCFYDINIDVRAEVREADNTLGKLDDPDGLTHIKNEEVAAVCHSARLHNEAGCLGYGHKVSYYTLIGNGKRAALCDLALKEGNDRAVRAKNVTKPYRGKGAPAIRTALHHHLAKAL